MDVCRNTNDSLFYGCGRDVVDASDRENNVCVRHRRRQYSCDLEEDGLRGADDDDERRERERC